MYSGIITADISDHFPKFLISNALMADSCNESICIAKQEISNKSITHC